MSSKPFKVIIAGGSIAGLTLANMLEKLGIDFVVLEAYKEIAPQVGASIGLLPNGLRVLDQLGLYPAIRGLIQEPNQKSTIRGPDGQVLTQTNKGGDLFRNRHGYDIIFVDRQMVLQALYNHLESKNKVLTSKKVASVTLQEKGVKVTTADGAEFTGDILIGADGVHSTVRNEMWRIADQLEPGYIPASERTALTSHTTYKCIFGISIMKDYAPSTTSSTWYKHSSLLVIAGPSNRVYWFMFQNIDKKYEGEELPRYSKQDEETLAKEHWNDQVTENITFGDMYAARISSVLTALPEYVFKKWHFRRIMTIGDAAHKFEPISGQGGNSAIETAAALVNNLTSMMKSRPEGLADADFDKVFSETQTTRTPRVWELVNASHQQQMVEAMETRLLEFMAKYYIPHATIDTRLASWCKSIEGGRRLDMLDMPKRPHYVPYPEELASTPFDGSAIIKLTVAAIFGLLFRLAQLTLTIDPASFSPTFVGHDWKQTYTGIPAIDSTLSILVWAFSKGVAGDDPNQKVQCLYFMIMLLPIALIWTVEAYRNGNHRSLVSMPVLFGIYQLFGIGKIAPLYYLVSIYTSGNILYTRTTGRAIHSSVAKALLPALAIGYVLPTILMFLPHESAVTHQNYVALWQPFPIYIAGLTFAISAIIRKAQGANSQPIEREMFALADVAPLRAAYGAVFWTTAIAHIATLVYLFSNTATMSISEVFFKLSGTVDESVFLFFKHDFLICFAAVFVWCLYSAYELRRTGYVKTEQAVRAALATLAAQVVVGPGAAYVGFWSWREGAILSHVKM
ncbi:FAD binding domain containing protein [Lasiodiplodia theobromae]|uniref:FAD binding domain containing protein n=1 Tax=Lasiodiplodia theobromae TaxID=45133 RepID=UPI0015C3B3A6|nr:FAD binding domain containing protein [Lasiodiplodia theobromae]KAF4540041.1 FAD binding domain containing protein [Lasiodiplodia theobromae]